MRCATSGRLAPAAATLTSSWPGPGSGVGCVVSVSPSGPPGRAISTARIVAGTSAIGLSSHAAGQGVLGSCGKARRLRQGPSHATLPRPRSRRAEWGAAMDWDELEAKPASAVALGDDLKRLSVAELEARIGALAAEIERVKVELAAKKAHEAAAAALFKR